MLGGFGPEAGPVTVAAPESASVGAEQPRAHVCEESDGDSVIFLSGHCNWRSPVQAAFVYGCSGAGEPEDNFVVCFESPGP